MSVSKRARRRNKGKRIEAEKRYQKALAKTWRKITKPVAKPKKEPAPVIIPLVRKVFPAVLADQIVGVQPMFGNTAPGIEPIRVNYDKQKKKTPKQRAQERRAKKIARSVLGETNWDKYF